MLAIIDNHEAVRIRIEEWLAEGDETGTWMPVRPLTANDADMADFVIRVEPGANGVWMFHVTWLIQDSELTWYGGYGFMRANGEISHYPVRMVA